MVQELRHVGESFGTKWAFVQWLRCMGFPKEQKVKEKLVLMTENPNHEQVLMFDYTVCICYYLCIIRVISVVKPCPQSTHRKRASPECARM